MSRQDDVVEWANLSAQDRAMVEQVYEVRDAAAAPLQSNFRVAAVVGYTDVDGEAAVMSGTNNETCFIHGSICAERSTIPRIRQLGYTSIDSVCITCDGSGCITPGLLCREYMCEVADPSKLRIILASGASEVGPDGSRIPQTVRVMMLSELYPYPPAYRAVSRYDVLAVAEDTRARVSAWWSDGGDSDNEDGDSEVEAVVAAAASAAGLSASALKALLDATLEETQRDARDILHPLRYAAGVVFADGSMVTGCETKALEYGATINPVIKLSKALEDARDSGVCVTAIVMMDQFGVLHAPMADSRSFLHEGDWDAASVLVHDVEGSGEIKVVKLGDLVPDSPRIEELFNDVESSPEVRKKLASAAHVPGVERQATLHSILGSSESSISSVASAAAVKSA